MRLSSITSRFLSFAFLVVVTSSVAQADVVVPDYGYFGNSTGVYRFDETTGAPVGSQPVVQPVGSPGNPADPGYVGDGYQAEGSAYGPDGNLYVGYFIAQGNDDTGIGEVRRYNGVTGAYIDTFVAPGSGGLVQPGDLKFDGSTLYVADHGNIVGAETPTPIPYGGTSVITYSATTGTSNGAINFGAPLGPSGLAFDPRPASLGGNPNNLYISLFNANEVVQYNTLTHAMTTYAAGSGMTTPSGIAFGPNGDLYVVNLFTASVQEFHQNAGGTADYVTALPTTGANSFPDGIAFTQGGQLLVSTLGPGLAPGAVLSYDAAGSTWNTFATSPSLGSPGPITLTPIGGDANADGVVNGLDLNLVASHWLSGSPSGDVNADGVINGLDINLIAQNWLHTNSIYGGGGSGGGAGANVPEPSTMAMLIGIGICGLTSTLRRRKSIGS
ncbi:MAG TPA: dockerin type I domain-containing protein [Pirellulales bacterium]|jgi:hypothetical protein